MHAMQRQFDIQDDIAQVAFIASNGEYDELVLEVDVDVEGRSLGAHCWQTVNGEIEQLSIFDIDEPDLMGLSFELHKEMKNHTGGDLKKYTLRIDKEGKARINFEYRNEPPDSEAQPS